MKVVFVIISIVAIIGGLIAACINAEEYFRDRAKIAEEASETHFQCDECGKWDYVKNLKEYLALNYWRALSFDVVVICSGGFPTSTSKLRILESEDEKVRVHRACSKVEDCPCVEGLRAKPHRIVFSRESGMVTTNYISFTHYGREVTN